jgi:hypothetical protein
MAATLFAILALCYLAGVDMRLPVLLGSGHQADGRVFRDERDLIAGCALPSGVLLHGVRGMCRRA